MARPDVTSTLIEQGVELPVELLSLVHDVDDRAALEHRIDDEVLARRRWASPQDRDAARADIVKVLVRCHEMNVVSDYDALYEQSCEYGTDDLSVAMHDVLAEYDDDLRHMVEDVIFGPLPQPAPVTPKFLELRPNPPLQLRARVRPLIVRARARESRGRSSVSRTASSSRDGPSRRSSDEDDPDGLDVVVGAGVLA